MYDLHMLNLNLMKKTFLLIIFLKNKTPKKITIKRKMDRLSASKDKEVEILIRK